MVGAAIRLDGWANAWMLLLVAAFQLLTAPVSAHLISRVAYRRRHVRRDLLLVDEYGGRGPQDDRYRGDEPGDAPPQDPAPPPRCASQKGRPWSSRHSPPPPAG